MSITKVYIHDYDLSYLEAKPESTAVAYSRQEIIWEDPNCLHEFVDLTAIWHDASEEPKDNIDEYGCGEDCLVIPKFGYAEIGQALFDDGKYTFSCNTSVYLMDEIKNWAYIKDLLPKGGK